MNNIQRLVFAIADKEGWKTPIEDEEDEGSVSYRNHNPGNLRSSPFAAGVKNNFAIFRNDEIGMMALYWDILQKTKGNTSTGLHPGSTLLDLIKVYAPEADGNDPQTYMDDITEQTGLKAGMLLSEFTN